MSSKEQLKDNRRDSGQEHGEITELLCPSCLKPLMAVSYEDTNAYRCGSCGGALVENDKLTRIIARRQKGFSERVKSLAKAVSADNQRAVAIKKLKGASVKGVMPLLSCPRCKRPMLRKFYSLAYLIEVDKCGNCGVIWFDGEELECFSF